MYIRKFEMRSMLEKNGIMHCALKYITISIKIWPSKIGLQVFKKRHQHIQEALTVEFHQQVFIKSFMTSKYEYHCRKDSKLKIYAKPLISKAYQKTNNNKCHSIYIRTVSIYPTMYIIRWTDWTQFMGLLSSNMPNLLDLCPFEIIWLLP